MQEISSKNLYPRGESNAYQWNRNPSFYPLNYGGVMCYALDMPGKSMHKGIKFLSLPNVWVERFLPMPIAEKK